MSIIPELGPVLLSCSINVNSFEEPEASLPQQLFCCAVFVFIFRKQYRKVLYCVVIIQKNYRAFLLRRRFLHLKKAAIVFQKQLRGQIDLLNVRASLQYVLPQSGERVQHWKRFHVPYKRADLVQSENKFHSSLSYQDAGLSQRNPLKR